MDPPLSKFAEPSAKPMEATSTHPGSKDREDAMICIRQLLVACGDKEPHDPRTEEFLYDFAMAYLDGVAHSIADKSTRNPNNLMDCIFRHDTLKREAAKADYLKKGEFKNTKLLKGGIPEVPISMS
ncbi:hypothetical protein P9112_002331 [Eukaryota sp. TZLM1-RC]